MTATVSRCEAKTRAGGQCKRLGWHPLTDASAARRITCTRHCQQLLREERRGAIRAERFATSIST